MRETTWLLSQAQAMALGSSFARAAYLSLRCNQPLLLPGGLPSDHPGSSTTLNRRTTQDPLTALAIVISPSHLALRRRFAVRSRHPAHRVGVLGHSAVHPQPARRFRDAVTCRPASRPVRISGASAIAAPAISSSSGTAGSCSRPSLAHVARSTYPSSARTAPTGLWAIRGPKKRNKTASHCPRTALRTAKAPWGRLSAGFQKPAWESR